MAVIYLRSTTGNNSNSGLTWALAKANLTNAMSAAGAGGTVYVSQVHAEAVAGSITAGAGSLASPTKVICGNDGAQPPTALANTATISSTGNWAFNGVDYYYGISFTDSAVGGLFQMGSAANKRQEFESCGFLLSAASGSGRIGAASSKGLWATWKNCSVSFGATTQGLDLGGRFHWNGGGMIAGSSTPAVLIAGYRVGAGTEGYQVLIENVDLSAFAATMNLTIPPVSPGVTTFRNCKLPASWSGSVLSSSLAAPGPRVGMYNCDSGSTNYKVWVEDYAGTIKDETTLVRTGGASDGVTTLSWKMASNANASYPLLPLASDEIVIWNDSTGSSLNVSVEILHDSATNLKDNEVWLEVNYPADSGDPMGALVTDAPNVLTAGADQTASSDTWTTTGMTNPNKQVLSVALTPQKKGFLIARVMLAKASKTIYVDPLLTVA